MPDSFEEALRLWETHARHDPLWAILSDPRQQGRRWDLASFLRTGQREISLLLYELERLDALPNRSAALDFGCGVGRLTEPLATYFDTVVGVDISPTMIRLARQLSSHSNASYVTACTLDDFPAAHFSLIYSDIVLQHIEPLLTRQYLTNFIRMLVPGGVLVFQLPSHRRDVPAGASQPHAMPGTAYRASVTLLQFPERLDVGQSTEVVVHVRHDGTHAWDQAQYGSLNVGNHWLAGQDGTMLIQDDARAVLPAQLMPGDECTVTLSITAPPIPGSYDCEIDLRLVHEGITWFADAGSLGARFPVIVGSAASRATETIAVSATSERPQTPPVDIYADLPPMDLAPPPFPMHGIHRDEVTQLLHAHGAVILSLQVDERCGNEWYGYRYYARKV